jgi:hypothetical protein
MVAPDIAVGGHGTSVGEVGWGMSTLQLSAWKAEVE